MAHRAVPLALVALAFGCAHAAVPIVVPAATWLTLKSVAAPTGELQCKKKLPSQ